MLLSHSNLFNKNILLAPLDWGMGHTARCVPLIKKLQQQNNRFVIACNKQQRAFLQQELNDVEYADLLGYNITYSPILPLWVKIIVQLPRLFSVVSRENKWLANYVKNNKTDIIISDNRFGFYHKDVESVFITHQLNIQAPVFKNRINRINASFIKRYNACWVPDYPETGKRLSGELSDNNKQLKNIEFIGPLSRFAKEQSLQKKYDVLILLSGPEPQRTLLENKLIEAFKNTTYKIVLVRGSQMPVKNQIPPAFSVINIAITNKLQELFNSSNKIICRSGYSTLMDLHAMDLKALLIPTPGQTEQEYLAAYWQKKLGYPYIGQKQITKESIQVFMNKA